MANLLPRSQAPYPALTKVQRARVATRARSALEMPWARLRSACAETAAALASELNELDEAPSPALAEALLAEIDTHRESAPGRVAAEAKADAGLRLLLYRPGCSLRSGEAEAASRGFFDVADRPPLLLWLEVVARPRAEGSDEVEVGLLCGVPEDAIIAAEAGVRACGTGSLVWLDDAQGEIVGRLPKRVEARSSSPEHAVGRGRAGDR